jgi:hypothetical protein
MMMMMMTVVNDYNSRYFSHQLTEVNKSQQNHCRPGIIFPFTINCKLQDVMRVLHTIEEKKATISMNILCNNTYVFVH